MQDIQGAGGTSPRIAGILLTMCRRTNHSRHIEEAVRKRYGDLVPVSYTHLRAHETVLDIVCRPPLEKNKNNTLRITDSARTQ